MPRFVKIGGRLWVNMDMVFTIEINQDANGKPTCRLNYTPDNKMEFTGDEAQELIRLLNKNAS